MGKFKELSSNLKPREKTLSQGIKSLSDIELLAIIIRTGTKNKNVLEVSSDLIYHFNGINNILSSSIKQLVTIEGINKVKAIEILAINELFIRALQQRQISNVKRLKLSSAEDVYNYCYPLFENIYQEKIVVFYLNIKNYLIYEETISLGDDSKSINNNKLICKKAIEVLAKKVIVVHNHPSNDCHPSMADITSYIALENALSNISIKLVDHLIISKDHYYSLAFKKTYQADKVIFE